MGRAMGIGLLGDPSLLLKKKYQWTLSFRVHCIGQSTPENFVKVAGKPNISINSVELNYLNEKNFIPGKVTWETINVTFLDAVNPQMNVLWKWLANVYNFTNSNRHMGAAQKDYTATGTLMMYSACGDPLETWTLQNCWPESINFGDLDYSSDDPSEIELTLRYTGVTYVNHCFPFNYQTCCTPCGSGTSTSSGIAGGFVN